MIIRKLTGTRFSMEKSVYEDNDANSIISQPSSEDWGGAARFSSGYAAWIKMPSLV